MSIRTNSHGSKASKSKSSLRASVTFPARLYKTLEDIAKQKKVSIAWVIRDAAEEYAADKWPLFGREHETDRK